MVANHFEKDKETLDSIKGREFIVHHTHKEAIRSELLGF
jgi:hypothetical protein